MVVTSPAGELRKSERAPRLIALPRRAVLPPYRQPATAEDVAQATGVGRMLREQDIMLGVAAKGKRSALTKIADRLGQRADMRGGAILAALLRRERLGSTGIGHGVAVPHARLDGIAEPAAMLTALGGPVWFGAPDDEPVDLLLTLLWPKDDVAGFLPTLASFCRLLRRPGLRARLREAATPAEAHAWLELQDGPLAKPPEVGPPGVGPLVARRRQRQPSPGATCLRIASITCAL
jgi:PTS system nitrogen regulatory IIA component